MAKKKDHEKTSSNGRTEGNIAEDHENGEEHKDLESTTPEVKRAQEKHIPNPWLPGPGRARTDLD